MQADVHAWDHPVAAFDLVVEIFSQFSAPADRTRKWERMRQALKPGGWLILQGCTPDQLCHRRSGTSDPAHLYTKDLLRATFGDFGQIQLTEEETVLNEGSGHCGASAVIGLFARRPL